MSGKIPDGWVRQGDGSFSPPNASAARELPHCDEFEQSKKQNENNYKSQSSIIEPPFRHESVAEEKGKAGNSTRLRVRVVSYRRRLCDVDNLIARNTSLTACVTRKSSKTTRRNISPLKLAKSKVKQTGQK